MLGIRVPFRGPWSRSLVRSGVAERNRWSEKWGWRAVIVARNVVMNSPLVRQSEWREPWPTLTTSDTST
jgi:hypothetical protein